MAEARKTPPHAAATDPAPEAESESTPKRQGKGRRLKRMVRKAVRAELRKGRGAAGKAKRRNPARRRRLMRKMRRLARLLRRN